MKTDMTDQPKQDAIVTQRDREVANSILWVETLIDDVDAIEKTLATYRAEIEAATIERCAGVEKRKTFPILGGQGAKVDFQLVADHGKQAKTNHYQTVERLAERGGLSWCELFAVLNNRKWQKMDENDAIVECRAIEARYLDAIERGDFGAGEGA